MFDQKDLTNAENVIRALKKGKFSLDGEEVLAFAEMLKWTAGLVARIKQDLVVQLQNKELAAAVIDGKTSLNTTKSKVRKGSE